jgi:hypothetical protein
LPRLARPPATRTSVDKVDDDSVTETDDDADVVGWSRRRLIPLAVAAPVDGDDDESITNVLDSMIVGLGLRNQVNSGIEDVRQQQLAAEQQARFEK